MDWHPRWALLLAITAGVVVTLAVALALHRT